MNVRRQIAAIALLAALLVLGFGMRVIVQGPKPTTPSIAAANVPGSTSVDITITTQSVVTPGAAPVRYLLEDATGVAGPWTAIADETNFSGSPLVFRRTGLPENTQRFYRLTASDNASPRRSALSNLFQTTTHDITPDLWDYNDFLLAQPNQVVEGGATICLGISTPCQISVVDGEYQIHNGGPPDPNNWTTTAGTIQAGDQFSLRTTAASTFATDKIAMITIGNRVVDWRVRTVAAPPVGISWPVHNPTYPQGPSAIPGHAFFGADSYGGGGRSSANAPGTPRTTVYFLNNFDNGAPVGVARPEWGPNVFSGNWRFCMQATATPKVVIPLIGGWLNFGDNPATALDLSHWSYWGHFAPGNGLFLRALTPVINGGHNNQIWHLRSYVGDDPDGGGYPAGARDGLTWAEGTNGSQSHHNLVINCEMFWSIDETYHAFFDFDDQAHLYNIYADPLHVSIIQHPEDPPGTDHGFGPIIGGSTEQPDQLVMMRSVFARQTARNPLTNAKRFTYANNILYDAINNGVHWHPTNSLPMFTNVLGSLFLRGPDNGSSMRSIACQVAVAGTSRTHPSFNSQHGWSNPASQLGFVTSEPFSGYSTNSLQLSALPAFWGDGALSGLLKWALNPLAPTTAELDAYINLMALNCGAQPQRRTSGIGRAAPLFNRMRDRIAGVVHPAEYGDTVTEYGGWFSVPTVGPINPLSPGTDWHAPFPTGADRDDTQGSATLINGLVVSGYTKLEIWHLNQHIVVGGFVPTSIP